MFKFNKIETNLINLKFFSLNKFSSFQEMCQKYNASTFTIIFILTESKWTQHIPHNASFLSKYAAYEIAFTRRAVVGRLRVMHRSPWFRVLRRVHLPYLLSSLQNRTCLLRLSAPSPFNFFNLNTAGSNVDSRDDLNAHDDLENHLLITPCFHVRSSRRNSSKRIERWKKFLKFWKREDRAGRRKCWKQVWDDEVERGQFWKKKKKKKIGRQKVKRTRKRDSKSLGGPLWKLVYVWLNSFGYLADLGMLVR